MRSLKLITAVALASALLASCDPLIMKADLVHETLVQTKVLSWRSADLGSNAPTTPSWSGLSVSSDGKSIAGVFSSGDKIVTSEDGGQSWSSPGSNESFNNLAASADCLTLVAGVSSKLYHSTDGGKNWFGGFYEPEAGHNWTDLAMSDSGSTIAGIVGGATLYFTRNTGATQPWSSIAGSFQFLGVSGDGTTLALADSNHDIEVTRNWGTSMTTPRALDNSAQITDLAISYDGEVIAVASGTSYSGGKGYLYLSSDGGSNFVNLTQAGLRYWSSVTVSDNGRVIAACATDSGGDAILRSKDGGLTWAEEAGAGHQAWSFIASSSDGLKYAAIAWGDKHVYIGE